MPTPSDANARDAAPLREHPKIGPLTYTCMVAGAVFGGTLAWIRPWAWVGYIISQALLVPAYWWWTR